MESWRNLRGRKDGKGGRNGEMERLTGMESWRDLQGRKDGGKRSNGGKGRVVVRGG